MEKVLMVGGPLDGARVELPESWTQFEYAQEEARLDGPPMTIPYIYRKRVEWVDGMLLTRYLLDLDNAPIKS